MLRLATLGACTIAATAFVTPSARAPKVAPLGPKFLEQLGLEKPDDAIKLVQDKVSELDLDSAKAFASKNLDVLKDNQERALVDVAAAAFCGLLFAGVYGAVVFSIGWFAAAPSTDAYAKPADSYAACIETALPGAAVGALVGMLLTFKIFSIPADVFAVLISSVCVAGARGAKLYLDTKTVPAVDDLTSVNVGALKWPSL